ncbi:hypothetical protein JCM17846_32060 [Iodidimonas nitroreducens]|uniref:DUF2842 domain-containing protein n=1 Tax=Iodidimonas nitroreducens TaxID=1236968 RepID=A0A5A7NCR7_9PROT|nr:DUF2842 domain-containing protein [Iodidimonas nitroreducens]GAK33985.1 hypothetical protein AQ1_01879 [alpha proteobacterium Q-1]GER05524.1 hypothetical protein JCM17846_32060 [Iodidimonas nitroreducens]
MALERASYRSLVGILGLVLGLVIYALGVIQIGVHLSLASLWLQTPFYVFAGLLWLWPARWLLRWIGKGRSSSEKKG